MSSRNSLDYLQVSDKETLLSTDINVEKAGTRRWSKASILSLPILLFVLCVAFSAWALSLVIIEREVQQPWSIPNPPPQEICDHATARPSWHDLPLHRRRGYTRAVQRLTNLPSRLGLKTSLYDDFTYVHIQSVWQTHHAAISLPYHRYFVYVFEQALRNEGGYDGPMPYWDWTRDADTPLESPIWDAQAGFGGNGSAPSGCIVDGVFGRIGKFANYSETGYDPHCVTRNFEDSREYGMLRSKQWTGGVVNPIVQTTKTYEDFREQLENGPHKHLHAGIGGEMPTAMSTNDNLFFLHHAQIDRLWWLWQQRNPESRNKEYFGRVSHGPGDVSDTGATLSDEIRLFGLAPDLTVGEVMTTNNELLCYKYK